MLQGEEVLFLLEAGGVACKAAACAHYPMTRNDDGDGVAPDSSADGLGRHVSARPRPRFAARAPANLCGNLPICRCFPVRNCQKNLPDLFLEGSSIHPQRRCEVGFSTTEIYVKPLACLNKDWQVFLMAITAKNNAEMLLAIEPQTIQRFAVTGKSNTAQRGKVV